MDSKQLDPSTLSAPIELMQAKTLKGSYRVFGL